MSLSPYRRGVVSEVNPATHQVRVKFLDRDQVESPWLDVLVRDTLDDKEFSLPSVGAQVACLLEENAEAGCVLGSLYSKDDAPVDPKEPTVRHWTFKDGAQFAYDRAAKKMSLTIPAGGSLELVVGGEVKITPSIVKVGDATDFVAFAGKCDANFNAIKAAHDAHAHPTGVGPSGPPPPLPAPDATGCTKIKTS